MASGYWPAGGSPLRRTKAAKIIIRFNHILHRIVLLIAQISILAMIAIVTLTVILRYCFNTGLSWAEEVPRLLVTIFAFMATAIGVRDHMHVAVNAIYNRFKIGGKARLIMDLIADIAVLACGIFMLYAGWDRTWRLFHLTGKMPITGINTAWQYLPIPVAGLVITLDSLLFLTGILEPDDLVYSQKEIDYTNAKEIAAALRKEDDE